MFKLVRCCSSIVSLYAILIIINAGYFADAGYMRGCYFTNWARYRQGRAKFSLDTYPKGMCTHIFYAFAKFGSNFEVEATDPEDLPSSYYEGTYATVTNLKKVDPSLKVLLSFGGYTFGGYLFSLMSSTEHNRQIFITSVINWLRKYNFDGIDIDWEYPSGNDKHTFVLLLNGLSNAFTDESQSTGRERLMITAAVPAGKATIDAGFDISALAPYLDYFMVMTYDYHGSWNSYTDNDSPLFARANQTDKTFCISWTMDYYAQMGAPKNKLIVGFPAYGRGWTLRNPYEYYIGAPASGPSPAYPYTQTAGVAAYFELCETLAKPNVLNIYNEEQEVPYFVYGSEWMSYDDDESFRYKAEWTKREGFGGGFVWTLDFDDFNGQCPGNTEDYPLIKTMSSIFATGSPPTASPTVAPPLPITTTAIAIPSVTPTNPLPIPTAAPPTTSPGVFHCPGDGLYADPHNCNMFYQCAFGVAHHMQCPSGLVFNPVYMNWLSPQLVVSNSVKSGQCDIARCNHLVAVYCPAQQYFNCFLYETVPYDLLLNNVYQR